MRATLLLLSLAATPLAARDIPLALPIDCSLGDTCFIQQYVDHDPGPGASDFTCGGLTYDGHKGTDFALPSLAAMAEGVAVLAAAPGLVTATRDGMPDTGWSDEFEGRDCGNGLVINHGGGWETQYCHLMQGSVAVTRGEKVAMGAMLGQVGYSGRTEFPHLHLTVRHNGKVIDPFDPDGVITCGAPDTNVLWSDPPVFQPGGVIALGFSAAVPEYDAVKAGTAHDDGLGRDAAALVLWGYAFGGQQGDIIHLTITGADGTVIDHDELMKRNQAQFFRAAGRKRPGAGWPAGSYTGTVTLTRKGAEVSTLSRQITLE